MCTKIYLSKKMVNIETVEELVKVRGVRKMIGGFDRSEPLQLCEYNVQTFIMA